MHHPQPEAVRSAVVVVLCCLGHSAQAFLPSGGLDMVRQRHMHSGSNVQQSSSAAATAASTPLPATEASARDADADADADGEPSSPATQRRRTWVQPFVSNPPAAAAAGDTLASHPAVRFDAPATRDAPAFVNRQTHYDMSVSAAAAAASSDEAAATATGGDTTSSSSVGEKEQAPAAASSSSSASASRKTWVQPSHPPTPVDVTTSKRAADLVASLPSRPGIAPTFMNRQTHYDMSVSAAATAATTSTAGDETSSSSAEMQPEAPAAASSSSSTATSRKTWVQPSHPPTPVDATTAKRAAELVASLPSRPGSTPTFMNRQTHYDMSASAAASSSAAAASEKAATTITTQGDTTSSSSAGENEQTPSAAAVAAAAAAAAAEPASSTLATATVLESSSLSSPSSDAAASAAADSTPSSPTTAYSSAEAPLTAKKVTPPPPPAAAKVASSPPPPPPVEFEPEPTLLSDSPVYQDVALTIRGAKETLAPFRKKIQDNVAEGNVGERGEEWALAQVAILLFVAMGSVPLIGGLITLLTGPGLVAGGIGVSAAGLKGLGKSLSPWPAPIEDNELSTEGIYGMMRHPTYTGLVMFCLGFGVVTDSPLRMLLAVVLALVLDKKADKEENMLIGLHGTAYEEYRKTVAKFVPRFY